MNQFKFMLVYATILVTILFTVNGQHDGAIVTKKPPRNTAGVKASAPTAGEITNVKQQSDHVKAPKKSRGPLPGIEPSLKKGTNNPANSSGDHDVLQLQTTPATHKPSRKKPAVAGSDNVEKSGDIKDVGNAMRKVKGKKPKGKNPGKPKSQKRCKVNQTEIELQYHKHVVESLRNASVFRDISDEKNYTSATPQQKNGAKSKTKEANKTQKNKNCPNNKNTTSSDNVSERSFCRWTYADRGEEVSNRHPTSLHAPAAKCLCSERSCPTQYVCEEVFLYVPVLEKHQDCRSENGQSAAVFVEKYERIVVGCTCATALT